MSEIIIDTENLTSEIDKLKTLREKISNNKESATTVVGGGTTVEEIENLGNEFKSMEVKMESLVRNTILFMNNVKNSYVTSDKNASKTFK